MILVPNHICIVGVGAVTAVGLNATATAAAIRAGIAGFQEHPYMINREGEPYVLAIVPSIDSLIKGSKRYVALTIPAVNEALKPLQQLPVAEREISVYIGLPEHRPGVPTDLPELLESNIKTLNNAYFSMNDVRVIFNGHAAGLMTVELAKKNLLAGRCEFCLIGGVDSYIDPDTLDWVEDNDQLHIPSNAWGFMPGEGAGFCLLCTVQTANRLGLPIKAQLLAVATAQEKNRIKTETVCIGEGLTEAVSNAIQALPREMKIHQVYCDQNGEAYRADEFGFMLSRLSEHFIDPSGYVAPADCWGDVGAASGPLFINQLCSAAEKNYSSGPVSLLWTSSEGGDRSAAIFVSNSSQLRRQ